MFVTKEEYRILKYVQKHNHVSKSELLAQFPHLSNHIWKNHMDMFLEELDENRRIYEEACRKIEDENSIRFLNGQNLISEDPELPDSPDNVFYYLNFNGIESLEMYKRDIWRFWVPYIITTVIAVVSLYVQFK